ncbi:Aste57867_3565 [Aphanomyces stellatus]|uniref:Aste57867_3565 protein n=1 Tax=Aphanomyces stellatus TaxID=120398 RepID=A0A485KDV4_9STRA|nr:hypothetical protein As57867_003554 [Aphanomyces stellatus]VFT80728.1 Aste57867_3565 [Aphanomyces stellatus]
MDVHFLGTGPSTGVPSIRCLLSGDLCAVCHDAHANPLSKNRRNNPTLLVRYGGRNVLIDCGKTFRDGVLSVFPAHGINHIDAVLLTHGHADACLGLDDLRELQVLQTTRCEETGEVKKIAQTPLLLHCHARTKAEVLPKFEYLMDKPVPPGSTYRWTAKLDWALFEDDDVFEAAGIHFTALPVIHGKGYICNGFSFGDEVGACFVYLSDVSEVPEKTMVALTKRAIDVLVIDALYLEDVHGAHMNLPQAMEVAKLLRPKKTYLIGMGDDFDYEQTNAVVRADMLQTHGLDVEMSYDGLKLTLG